MSSCAGFLACRNESALGATCRAPSSTSELILGRFFFLGSSLLGSNRLFDGFVSFNIHQFCRKCAVGLGFIDPVKTPAEGAGITEHLAINTYIEGGKIKTSLVDVKGSGRRLRLSPEDLFGKTVAFPEELELRAGSWRASRGQRVKVVKDGHILTVSPKEVDYLGRVNTI